MYAQTMINSLIAVILFFMVVRTNAQGILGADWTGTGTVLQAHGGEMPRMSAYVQPYDNQNYVNSYYGFFG